MPSVDSLRSTVEQLEAGIAAKSNDLKAYRKQFNEIVTSISETEQTIQLYRSTLADAQKELIRQELQEATEQRAAEIDNGLTRLTDEFLSIAEDKLWFTGTGNDDAILPHQWQAAQFGAVAKRWILGDGVGLGKTRSTVAWLDLVKAKRVLVVCEANIVNQFAGEIMELAPHRTVFNLYKKSPEAKHLILDNLPDEAVIVANFENWRLDHDILAKLLDWEMDTVIVDEAHNLKTTNTANFKYMKILIAADNVCANCRGHIRGLFDPEKLKEKPSKRVPVPCNSCGWKYGDRTNTRYANKFDTLLSTRSVKNVCFTTGTPILNDPADIFSLLHLLNPILFTTKAAFQREYLTRDHHANKWIFRDSAMLRLKPMLKDILLARTLNDTGVQLPKQHVRVWPVELDEKAYPLQYRTITQISKAAQIVLDSGEEASIMDLMSLITRKRQANVWPGGIQITDTRKDSPTYGEVLLDVGSEVQESVKMDEIIDHIIQLKDIGDEDGVKHPVQLVYSQFKTGLAELEDRLLKRGLRVARFDGDTKESLRKKIKDNLNRRNEQEPLWDVVLANYKTGGTGLNFTWATATHIMDEEWGPGKRDQAYGRTKRMGQVHETRVYIYRIPGTIDIWMSNTIKRKENIINGFTEGMTVQETIDDFLTQLQNGMIL